jgi:hypothetical protein
VSLPGFRDYCRTMAERDDVDQRDRDLWVQLADEVDVYLGDTLDEEGVTDCLDLDLFGYPAPPPRPMLKGRPIEDAPPL